MKIGIIGLGDIAQKAYLPVIATLPNVELVLCTRNSDVVNQLAQQYRVTETCTDYKQLLSHHVDAVMVHAATSVHPEIAGFFLKNGIPTFVDKPLADSAQACETLYEIAEQYHQPLYVGFNRRHIPLFNHRLPELQTNKLANLRSLRWEKNRYNLTGDVRTFIFDDFIHPLDSVNVCSKADLQDVYVTHQRSGDQLARLDVQWQTGETILHASMNRQFGITGERVQVTLVNEAYEFDSFVSGQCWKENQQHSLVLKDWTPMLESKGFKHMILDWLSVVQAGVLSQKIVDRNIASHQLAEAICNKISGSMR